MPSQNQNLILNLNKPIRLFLQYVLPSIASMVVSGLYIAIDGFFIGHQVGFQGLAGINFAWAIYIIVFSIASMISTGTATYMSIHMGKNDIEKTRNYFNQGLKLIITLGLIITVILTLTNRYLLTLMGATGKTLQLTLDFLNIVSLGSLISIGSVALPNWVRNDGKPKLATYIIITGALVNTFLDYLLIIVFHYALKGAAFATIVAQCTTVLWSLYTLKQSKRNYFKHFFAKPHNSIAIIKDILITGLPSMATLLFMSLQLSLHNRLFVHYANTTTVAAYAIVGYIQDFVLLIIQGVANGVQPIISYCKGQNKLNLAKKYSFFATITTLSISLLAFSIIMFYPKALISIFNTTNATLTTIASYGLRLNQSTLYLNALIILIATLLQALALNRLAITVALTHIFIQVPLLFILPVFLNTTGIWLVQPASDLFMVLGFIIGYIYYNYYFNQSSHGNTT